MNIKIEKSLFRQGYKSIAGVDEVGTGAIFGDVYAAAVILDFNKIKNLRIPLKLKTKIKNIEVTDSKKLTKIEREALAEVLKNNCKCYSIGIVSIQEINTIKNINQVSHLAMKRAVTGLKVKPDFVLIDGKYSIDIDMDSRPIIKGDLKSVSIGAASILAKVARDSYIVKMASNYPQYYLENNMGYATKNHKESIEKYGLSDTHRVYLFKKKVKSATL